MAGAYLTTLRLLTRPTGHAPGSLVTCTTHFRHPLPSLRIQSILLGPLSMCLLVQGPPRLPMELELLPARPCPRQAAGARNHQQVCKSNLRQFPLLGSEIILLD